MRIRLTTIVFAVALMTASLTGCSSAKKDEALATQIRAQMVSDPQVKAANVEVTVKDGEATLTGDVPDEGARLQAYKLASDTAGVKHVVDQMTVYSAAAAAPPAAPEPAQPVREKERAVKTREKRAP